jgi:aminoacyl-tRNA hydrolase
LHIFRNVRDAAEYLKTHTRDGDLVLLKGTNKQDHLLRIIMARTGSIACWRDNCERHTLCNECADRNKPSGLPALIGSAPAARAAPGVVGSAQLGLDPDEQVIVGLGNPESTYVGTPHNVGYEVVERLADSLGLTWDATPAAWIARGKAGGRPVCLIKLRVAMNLTGAALKALSDDMAFGPERCVLVHDDLDMSLGSVRTRLSGGGGGHRGVTSILEAFQTDAFRRVKIGVGQAGAKVNRVDYVLSAFDATSRSTVDPAIAAAGVRALELVERCSLAKQE